MRAVEQNAVSVHSEMKHVEWLQVNVYLCVYVCIYICCKCVSMCICMYLYML